jgi:hypothetical protein
MPICNTKSRPDSMGEPQGQFPAPPQNRREYTYSESFAFLKKSEAVPVLNQALRHEDAGGR